MRHSLILYFFANSGAEAIECSLKMARKYHAHKGDHERYRVITFEGAFHGRTYAALAAGGQEKYLEGFGPALEGFDQVEFGDYEAVKALMSSQRQQLFLLNHYRVKAVFGLFPGVS